MLELWGGVECSVVRIRSAYRDQIAETGHRDRIADLDAIAGLGIRTLRYPILWEHVAPADPENLDWSWHDARLPGLHRLGIRVIAGLVHHGSGPRYTSLADPAFPTRLARYARQVAARYPWIDRFTPVNEPLTTARFAGLYGHWYPHRRSEGDFLRMVVNQCRAVLLAMRAIRTVTPGAQLIQTEDIGKTFSTPALADQAAYENERRWLSLDLLCGRVDRFHPWFGRCLAHGVNQADLEDFLTEDACPALIGANHYLTSERYLDGRVRTYPKPLRGGNGRYRYADVEAVRMRHLADQTGPKARLMEIWERYRQRLAVTEVHHGCSRDDQLRWFTEVWQAALDLRAGHVPVEAVTLWSLFGAVDWNSLLLRRDGHYEPGAFDIRAPQPRLTALGRAARDLAATGQTAHPVLTAPGWWRRSGRYYTPDPQEAEPGDQDADADHAAIAVMRDAGRYAEAVAQICAARGLKAIILGEAALPAALLYAKIWAVLDPTTLPTAATAHRYPAGSFWSDIRAGMRLAALSGQAGVPFLTFSSGLVFDGRAAGAPTEADPVRPSSLFGRSAAERETRVCEAHPGALIARTGLVFGQGDERDIALQLLLDPPEGWSRSFRKAPLIAPTYLPDLVHAALDLLIDGETGLWHLANTGETTWPDFVRRLAAAAGQPGTEPCCGIASGPPISLASGRSAVMPTLDGAVARYADAVLRPLRISGLAAE
ncbi:dTDP-4-dehydrorhamnose reductase [Methylobacterium sp. UNC378MF]|uniref:sugar nucleotide-binding protein n=1 Tax=Methylobacterium sp. UNC378MF TaxID=1502748 RepID=UPI0008923CEB|nr:sugar nucleotide-binding protein [Methylobacterium sp. UNC378MF]SDA15516.1 dTDP-4-dehydrorhamnose reductase [Methylobacterium sp. UNC378MF]